MAQKKLISVDEFVTCLSTHDAIEARIREIFKAVQHRRTVVFKDRIYSEYDYVIDLDMSAKDDKIHINGQRSGAALKVSFPVEWLGVEDWKTKVKEFVAMEYAEEIAEILKK